MFLNPFQEAGSWYKANLHTHTTASDGQATQQERVAQYRTHGYSVLAITDHGVGSDAAGLSTGDLLVMDGIEVTVSRPDDERFYHLVCLNVPPDATVPATADPNDVITWAKQEGGETLIAHPYWSGNNVQDLLPLRGHVGIEVHNAGCQGIGKAFSSVHWDNLLDRGVRTPAVAVDDTHSGNPDSRDVFGGWVMLKMSALTASAVLEALRTGCYYSSSGAEVFDFGVKDGKAYVRCSEAKEIHLMAGNWHGRSAHAEGDRGLTEAEVEVGKDWKYVRAEVVDAGGGRAWTNPIYL